MSLIKNFNASVNFWDANPQFTSIEPFKTYQKKDKSKEKKDSSLIMWGLAFYYDEESIYYSMQKTDKEQAIAVGHFGDRKFPWDSIRELMEAFELVYLTPARRQLYEWNRLMNEKTEFMSGQTYNEKNWEMLEKMLGSNKKLFDEYDAISKRLANEKDSSGVKGGASESASEAGLI